jgi:hypothetical protein
MPQVEDAREAAIIRAELAAGWDNPAAAAALAAWDARTEEGAAAAGEVSVDHQADQAKEEQGGYNTHQAGAEVFENIMLDSEERLKLVEEAEAAPAPLVVADGNGGERETTLDEQIEFKQQAMWDSLNPIQKGLISLGQGVENAWDMVGLGSVEDAQEVVFEAVEKGDLYDGIELLGSFAEVGGAVGGIGAAAKLTLAGLKAAVNGSGRGIVNGIARFADAVSDARVANQALDVVAKSKGGKAAIKAAAKVDDPRVAERLVDDIIAKAEVVAEPLMKSRDIRALNPVANQKAVLKRQASQKAAQQRIKDEAAAANAAIRRHAEKGAQKKALARQNAEQTLGLRGQGKRFQQEKNKAAIKNAPGGF